MPLSIDPHVQVSSGAAFFIYNMDQHGSPPSLRGPASPMSFLAHEKEYPELTEYQIIINHIHSLNNTPRIKHSLFTVQYKQDQKKNFFQYALLHPRHHDGLRRRRLRRGRRLPPPGHRPAGRDHRLEELSSCLSENGPAADLDFNVKNTTMGCITLPYAVESLQLAALRDGPYLVSYFTDDSCADLTRGTTVSEVGNCMHSAIGPWASINISTYE
ncbi:hypothetical protein BJ166DRAFT_609787 [Pestalotiopsis sp. NC0098]|nr:hypothetical protein BJ166DRAFT_609787 [Pestalotiopsis sp. NC0098]